MSKSDPVSIHIIHLGAYSNAADPLFVIRVLLDVQNKQSRSNRDAKIRRIKVKEETLT